MTVRVRSKFHAAKSEPMVGILIRTRIGMEVYGTNTRVEQIPLGELAAGDELEVDFHIECWLTPQQYTLTVATQSSDGSSHDWLDDAIVFDVVDTRVAAGVAMTSTRAGGTTTSVTVPGGAGFLASRRSCGPALSSTRFRSASRTSSST